MGVPKISAAQPIGPIKRTTAIRIENDAHQRGRTPVRNATIATCREEQDQRQLGADEERSPVWWSVPAVAALMLSWSIAAPMSPAGMQHPEAPSRQPHRRTRACCAVWWPPSASASRVRSMAGEHEQDEAAGHPQPAAGDDRVSFPWNQVRSCASVGWCGILSLRPLVTTSPAIQSATARDGREQEGALLDQGHGLFLSIRGRRRDGAAGRAPIRAPSTGEDEQCEDDQREEQAASHAGDRLAAAAGRRPRRSRTARPSGAPMRKRELAASQAGGNGSRTVSK